jgi:polar amino acid transport system permease protein
METWSRFLDTFFKWQVMERYLPAILKGVVVTIEVAAAVVVTGILFGLSLAIVRAFRVLALNALIVVFVDMLRALPPLVLILLVYFGLPNIGINLPSFAVLWLVLALVLAAFAEEIFWAGILSIPKGQWEAARSTGLGFLGTLAYVILPQAIRLTVPPLTNRTIAITKNTALGTVIGVGEILNQATSAESFSGNATPLMMGAIAYLILFAIVQQFFNLGIMREALPLILEGLKQTLIICLIVIPLGLVGGLAFALISLSRIRAARWTMIAAIDFFRSIPPLVLLIFIYAGLPFAGLRLSPLTAVAIAFFLNTSSYYGEIYRAGIESVGLGQWDAARSTGLRTHHTLAYVVLPQAVRNVLPDLVSNTVEVVKLTSIASVVALPELLYSADMARSVTFNSSPIVLAAAIYIAMLWPVVRLISRLERRIAT